MISVSYLSKAAFYRLAFLNFVFALYKLPSNARVHARSHVYGFVRERVCMRARVCMFGCKRACTCEYIECWQFSLMSILHLCPLFRSHLIPRNLCATDNMIHDLLLMSFQCALSMLLLCFQCAVKGFWQNVIRNLYKNLSHEAETLFEGEKKSWYLMTAEEKRLEMSNCKVERAAHFMTLADKSLKRWALYNRNKKSWRKRTLVPFFRCVSASLCISVFSADFQKCPQLAKQGLFSAVSVRPSVRRNA